MSRLKKKLDFHNAKKKMILMPGINEAAYPGNIGFEEMVKFYKYAMEYEIEEMEKVIQCQQCLRIG